MLPNVKKPGRLVSSMDAEAAGIRIRHFENSRALGSGVAHGREAILARRGNSTDEHGTGKSSFLSNSGEEPSAANDQQHRQLQEARPAAGKRGKAIGQQGQYKKTCMFQ